MHRAAITFAALVLSACSSPTSSGKTDDLVFRNVNVVSVGTGTALADQTVLIRRGRIARLGPSGTVETADGTVEIADGTAEIDARGAWLLPGLIDMHVHHYGSGDIAGARDLFLAHGVTTVRHMWGYSGILAERDAIESGAVEGPRIFAASPGLDGAGGRWQALTPPVTTPAEARAAVDRAALEGYDFIKVYSRLDPASFDAAVQAARRHGMPVVGHIPNDVGFRHALGAGMSTVEHLLGFRQTTGLSTLNNQSIDLEAVAVLAEEYAAAGVWVVPTMHVGTHTATEIAALHGLDVWSLVPPSHRDFWLQFPLPARDPSALDNYVSVLKILEEHDVGILAGTDAGIDGIVNGYSMWQELDKLALALGPAGALQAATIDAATALGVADRLGQVKQGYDADLVLLSENPLDDITAVATMVGVVTRGRWRTRLELLERQGPLPR